MPTYCDGCGEKATGRCPYCDTAGCDECIPICDHDVRKRKTATPVALIRCEDCPPIGYPTDDTRCLPCDRRALPQEAKRD